MFKGLLSIQGAPGGGEVNIFGIICAVAVILILGIIGLAAWLDAKDGR